jgi:cytoskeleton protein RodZ
MNDLAPPGLEPADANDAPTEPTQVTPQFGLALAQAREARGLSVADMAARLRLHPRQIAALEQEQLDSLPAAPFVRGFVRNYAKELQLDPVPLLAALNAKLPVADAQAETLTATGITAAEVRRSGMERTSRIAVIGGTVVLLIVLGLIGWVASKRAPAPPASAPASSSAPASESQAPGQSGVAQPATAAPAEAVASAANPDSNRPTPETSAPASASTSAGTAPQATPPAAAAVASGLRLVVGERPSWVEVTQADGRIVLTGLQEPGTERRLGNLQPPLQLVIGNASSVTLEYRGKTIDLNRHVRANDLARLTLE